MAMIHLEPQTLEMFSRALDGLKPPPNLSLSQWADKYRKLSAEASASQGQWNTDAAPFQREIMDAIGDVHVRKVVAMMCAQAGKSFILYRFIFKFIGNLKGFLLGTTQCAFGFI